MRRALYGSLLSQFHPNNAQTHSVDPALDAHPAWSAMVSKAAAARAAATRTWFHAVHFVTYSSQRSATSEPWGCSVASLLLSGTLHTIVTPMVPTMYSAPPASTKAVGCPPHVNAAPAI